MCGGHFLFVYIINHYKHNCDCGKYRADYRDEAVAADSLAALAHNIIVIPLMLVILAVERD